MSSAGNMGFSWYVAQLPHILDIISTLCDAVAEAEAEAEADHGDDSCPYYTARRRNPTFLSLINFSIFFHFFYFSSNNKSSFIDQKALQSQIHNMEMDMEGFGFSMHRLFIGVSHRQAHYWTWEGHKRRRKEEGLRI